MKLDILVLAAHPDDAELGAQQAELIYQVLDLFNDFAFGGRKSGSIGVVGFGIVVVEFRILLNVEIGRKLPERFVFLQNHNGRLAVEFPQFIGHAFGERK